MIRRLLISYLTVTVLALTALVIPLGLAFTNHERDTLLAAVERDATAVAALVEDDLEAGTRPQIDSLLTEYAGGGGRIVVTDTGGVSRADSVTGPGQDFTNRPEVTTALAGERALGIRRSETLGGDLVYVAVPVTSGGQVHGAVRVTYPIRELDVLVQRNWLRLTLLSLGILVAVAVIGTVLARQVTRPVRRLEDAARDLADGRLDARVPVDVGPPELRSLGETFNRTAGRLERLLTAQRQFVADASHQLRSPLTALRLRLENLERHVPAEQQDRLRAAVRETDRLGRVVESLLLLARADAAAGTPGPVDVDDVLRGRLEVWRTVAAQQDVRLVDDVTVHALALGLPGALEQILDNLLSNAITASQAGGTVTVGTSASEPGWVEVSVTDDGPGLSEEQRLRAFDRFWQAPDRAGGGSGLGLAIARDLAEVSGATITLQPGPGDRGLRASVRLAQAPARFLTSS
ncbi:ATP-binding protein [Blastococcus sp. CT_GayMR16]|uniref:sensor histidine kinase n=1 Tax=Blastococcus sp. CT_GayMR16 TaxID=2559607 RepID=UPI00107376FD|nr:ATP-binding protein [Blastococcus sp. CT_GayMR16]TFV89916.1 HAMP domain-containing protein [Blastococcus sp. CT_GayMR16]